jgi:hypothetical protein
MRLPWRVIEQIAEFCAHLVSRHFGDLGLVAR